MGSFANSLHVKCDDANEVVDSINNAMQEAGCEATDEEPDEDAMWGMSSGLRAMQVAEAHDGWVAVLDSDLMESVSLAIDLSRRLETFAIHFIVNDSDSWHYQLFRNGRPVDEFDSSAGWADAFEMDEDSPDILPMFPPGGLAAMQGDMEHRMREIQEQIETNMPADIRDIQQRVQAGAASHEEMKRLGEWIQTQSQQFLAGLNDMMSGILPSRAGSSASESDLDSQLEKLRPILSPGVPDDRVLEILEKQAVFAEETLAEFMDLIGVQSFFANLSYRYLAECTASELLSEGVKLAAHLKFATDTFAG